MIIRNAKDTIRIESEEILLKLSYTVADVREWMQSYYELIGLLPFSDSEFCHYLKHSYLQHFGDKWQDNIAAWAWAVALRHGFVVDTASGYIVSARYVLKRSGGTAKGCIIGV